MSSSATRASSEMPFEAFLSDHDQASWLATVTSLRPAIHQVDQAATQIWFAFYPLDLFLALQGAEDPEKLAAELLLQGDYRLANQIDSSHKFLYGHRYWPAVKKAVTEQAKTLSGSNVSLAEAIISVAQQAAGELKVDVSLVVGISAVAFMTIRQVGVIAFSSTPGEVLIDRKHVKKSADQILKERAKDDSQGLLGFLKTVDKKWTVTFDENDPSAKYTLNDMQDLAWGAANDRSRDWRAIDPRRIEGPIPVECRSASCGTCWVGVLGGAEKLSAVATRESKKIKEFGYIETDDPRPIIRLSCQAQAGGAVSIVIPPWNGVFGKFLKNPPQKTAKEEGAAPVN